MSKITPGVWTGFIGLFDGVEKFCVGIPETQKAVAVCGIVGATDEDESIANVQFIADAANRLARMAAWITGHCRCPCCDELQTCSEGCTFSGDAPNEYDEMMGAREALYGSEAMP